MRFVPAPRLISAVVLFFAAVCLQPPAMADQTFTQSDCLFNWAERTYPNWFAPAAAISNTLVPYYYRLYLQTNAYLVTSSADSHVYYLGPLTNNSIIDLGALSGWLSTAGCQIGAAPTTSNPVAPSLIPPGLTKVFEYQFETSPTEHGIFQEQSATSTGGNQIGTPPRATVVSGGRGGGNAVRLHTEPGDSWGGGPPRCDLEHEAGATGAGAIYSNPITYKDVEQWWEHSVYLPSDFNAEGSDSYVVADFHPPGGSIATWSNYQIEMRSNNLGLNGGIWLIGHSGPISSADTHGPSWPGTYGYNYGPTVKEVWYDFVHHVRWSSGSDGFMQTWLNGKLIVNYTGPTLYSESGTTYGVFLKLANYHDVGSPNPSSVIHDRVILWSVP